MSKIYKFINKFLESLNWIENKCSGFVSGRCNILIYFLLKVKPNKFMFQRN